MSYSPLSLEEVLSRKYSLVMPQTEGKKVGLSIRFEGTKEGQNAIDFCAWDYDLVSKGGDFNDEARVFAEFKVILPRVLGPQDWAFYLDRKDNGDVNVKAPEQAAEQWNADNNFHDFLAGKLKAYLERHGLVCPFDPEDTDLAVTLIGLYVLQREFALNPDKIRMALGL